MHDDATSADRARRDALQALDRLLAAWPGSDSCARAVAETVARHGYAAADVEGQLRHVALRCRGRTMQLVLDAEVGAGSAVQGAPSHVLVLASGRMPGLVVEGIAAAVSVGAVALVRPSRDETVLQHLLVALHEREPELAARVEVVAADGREPPWERAGAAVVFGSDETVALVRGRLPPAAASRVAGYGSRQGIAVIGQDAAEDPGWAERLADDVLAFRQAGCMSPSWLYVLGDAARTQEVRDDLERELARAHPRHVAPGLDTGIQQRHGTDADVLAAIAAGTSTDPTTLRCGDASLNVVTAADPVELAAQVSRLGSLLQTAVLATGSRERAATTRLLLDAGVTRVCLPGDAHRPDPTWPQDGIGRVAPLLA